MRIACNMGKFAEGAGFSRITWGEKNRKCKEFLICAYGFLAILCDFLIFAYQIFGRVCEIFVNLGPDAAAWAFSGRASTAILRGRVGVLGRGHMRILSGIAGLYSGPIWGLARDTKRPPAFAGGVVALVIYCALLSGIRPPRQGVFPRLFQRCGRAFCLPRKQEQRQSA